MTRGVAPTRTPPRHSRRPAKDTRLEVKKLLRCQIQASDDHPWPLQGGHAVTFPINNTKSRSCSTLDVTPRLHLEVVARVRSSTRVESEDNRDGEGEQHPVRAEPADTHETRLPCIGENSIDNS